MSIAQSPISIDTYKIYDPPNVPTTCGIAGLRTITYIAGKIRKTLGKSILSEVVCVRASTRCCHSPDPPPSTPTPLQPSPGGTPSQRSAIQRQPDWAAAACSHLNRTRRGSLRAAPDRWPRAASATTCGRRVVAATRPRRDRLGSTLDGRPNVAFPADIVQRWQYIRIFATSSCRIMWQGESGQARRFALTIAENPYQY